MCTGFVFMTVIQRRKKKETPKWNEKNNNKEKKWLIELSELFFLIIINFKWILRVFVDFTKTLFSNFFEKWVKGLMNFIITKSVLLTQCVIIIR